MHLIYSLWITNERPELWPVLLCTNACHQPCYFITYILDVLYYISFQFLSQFSWPVCVCCPCWSIDLSFAPKFNWIFCCCSIGTQQAIALGLHCNAHFLVATSRVYSSRRLAAWPVHDWRHRRRHSHARHHQIERSTLTFHFLPPHPLLFYNLVACYGTMGWGG